MSVRQSASDVKHENLTFAYFLLTSLRLELRMIRGSVSPFFLLIRMFQTPNGDYLVPWWRGGSQWSCPKTSQIDPLTCWRDIVSIFFRVVVPLFNCCHGRI